MTRGRKPKPATEKRIRGNPGKRPIGTLVPAPRQGDLLCPQNVADDARAVTYWDLCLREAAPGHLAPIDAPLLANLCMTLSRIDQMEALLGAAFVVRGQKGQVQNPLLGMIARQTTLALRLAAELSLTPAQRNRLGLHDTPPPDLLAERYF